MKSLGKLLTIPLAVGLLSLPLRGEIVASDDGVKIYQDSDYDKRAEDDSQRQLLAEWPFKLMFYQVQKGESLASIEKKFYGIDLGGNFLSSKNPEFSRHKDGKLQSDLQEGDYLTLPTGEFYRAKVGDTFESLAKQEGITVEQFREDNSWISGDVPALGSFYFIESNSKPSIQSPGLIEDVSGLEENSKNDNHGGWNIIL